MRAILRSVWVGFDQPQPIGTDAYGARYALPTWADFMQRAGRIRVPSRSGPRARASDSDGEHNVARVGRRFSTSRKSL